MALIRDLSSSQLAFQVGEAPVDQFLVTRYRGTEGLCQLYRFEIELVSEEDQVDFAEIVGKSAALSINTAAGTRYFHGIVSRFELTGQTVGRQFFRAELVPAVWTLTHRYGSRIFQNKSVTDIISDVLTQAGITSDRVRMTLNGTHNTRDYCVQYRETDYNFICRLMEEEGIWWYFEQTQEAHILVLADDASAYAPIEGEPQIRYCDPTGLKVETENVYRFRRSQAVRPGAVVLDDFSFENPKLNLQAKADSGRDAGLEFSDYPGEYKLQADGTTLAQLRAEEFEASRILGVGQSNSYRLAPGYTFELTEHPASSMNGSYLLTSVSHQGRQATTASSTGTNGRTVLFDQRVMQSLRTAQQNENPMIRELAGALLQIGARLQGGDPTANRALTQWLYHAGQVARELPAAVAASGGNPLAALTLPNLIDDVTEAIVLHPDALEYECRFECIPAAVVYRPARVTPWPVMRGAQTARVVGPSGEEIYTDEYGRVKVKFNWDREGKFDENSSCWIRVSQGMAGGQYGMMFLPRVGQEVIVDFLEGDPDQPIIVGRVFNADHMPPYALPDEKTKSVIKTRSSKGGEGANEIRFEDLKDSEQILIHAQKDLHVRAQNDRVETIGANRHLDVGNDRIEQVKKDYSLTIKEGSRKVEIKTDDSLKVQGKVSIQVTGTHSTNVSGDVVEKFDGNHKHEVATTYAAKAMSIKLEASSGIELKCGGSSIVLTPAAIFIVGGPLVNINSGSGPPVGPVTASATSREAPAEPGAADTVQFGQDTSYGGGEALAAAEAPADVAGHEFEQTEVEEETSETTWIDISLVDEEGMPVAGERYRVTDSAGKVFEGSLDANGRAHVTGISPGTCEVTFPNRDESAWQKNT